MCSWYFQLVILMNGGKMKFMHLKRTLLESVKVWLKKSQSRNELRTMDDRSLRDIGLTRADVIQDINRSYWI